VIPPITTQAQPETFVPVTVAPESPPGPPSPIKKLSMIHEYKDASGQPIRVASFCDQRLAIGTNSQSLVIFDSRLKKILNKYEKIHAGSVYTIAWDPCGEWIATGSNDQTVKICRLGTGDQRSGTRIQLHAGTVRSICASSSTSVVAGCSGDSILRSLDVTSGNRVLKSWPTSIEEVCINSVSIDREVSGNSVLIGLSNGAVSLLDIRSSAPPAWALSQSDTGGAQAKIQGQSVLVGYGNGSLAMYDTRRTDHSVWETSRICTSCRSVDMNDQYIALGGFDQKVRILDRFTGTVNSELSGHTDKVVHVAWNGNSSLVSCGTDSRVIFWSSKNS